MVNSSNRDEDRESAEIQEYLQQISAQLGLSTENGEIAQLYQSAQELLSHLPSDSLTLARVAGVMLVYQLPDADPDEATWFRNELKACPDAESVEELIDSISRPDAL